MGGTPRTRLGRDFALLWAAASVSLVGDGIRVTVLPLLAVSLSPTPWAVSLVTFAGTAPVLLFSLLGGALADRHDRRKLMWRTDAVRGVVIAAFAGWVLLSPPPIYLLVALTFLVGSAGTVFDNAASGLLPDVVDRDQLPTANGRLQGSQLVGLQFIGPPVGAALFAVTAGLPLLLDALSFVLAAILVAAIHNRQPTVRERSDRTIRADIAEGVRWLWRQKGLRLLAVELGLANLTLQMGTAMLPLLVVTTLHAPPAVYGLVLVAGAVGGLLGSFAAGRLRTRVKTVLGIGLSISLIAVALLLVGVAGSVPVVAIGYAVGGFGIMLWNVQAATLRQRLTPRDLMGRVSSVYRLIGWGGGPIGAALGGVLGTAFGVRLPIIVGGAILAVSLVLVPRLAALDTAT